MKIERYISLMVVLVVGLFLAPASWAETTSAQNQTLIGPSCVQCYAPANTWCVPATSSAAVPETVQPVKAPARAVTRAETPWEVLGSVLAVPFEIGQCIFTGCPQ
jgi:hypothetical protein